MPNGNSKPHLGHTFVTNGCPHSSHLGFFVFPSGLNGLFSIALEQLLSLFVLVHKYSTSSRFCSSKHLGHKYLAISHTPPHY